MDHLSRKDLKKDTFALEVGHGVEYVTTHKSQVARYGILVLVILLAAGGYYIYSTRQAAARELALAQTQRINGATVGAAAAVPPNLNFATQEEKDKALTAAYQKMAEDYRGSVEGTIAQLYLAAAKMDKGEADAAIPMYQQVIDNAPAPFVSVAKMALGQVLYGKGKTDEGVKLLQSVIDSPTEFVSKEEATLTLGRLLARAKPDEARKLLDPLVQSRTTISSAAVEVLGTLPPKAN
ncbi:MAG: tetratricopeptide repeat protein [Acidobacteriota bacterium]